MNMFHTYISEESKRLVQETLDSGRLSEGERVKEFESELSRCGIPNPVTVNSGTSALHLALVVAGVEPGDEVILPAQTFVATGMAIKMCGATPVFCDINPHTGNLDPHDLKRHLTPRTAAVIPVHWTGLICDIDPICDIAQRWYGDRGYIQVIEDAAHAFGATYNEQSYLGHGSEFVCFSLQASKQITSGDGGILCCQFKEDEKEVRRRRWFGISRNDPVGILGEREFELSEIGFKYHLSDVAASVGLGNLRDFPQRLKRRQEIGSRFRQEFSDTKNVELLDLPAGQTHAYYAFSMKVNRREDFVKKMKEKGVPCSIICSRIDKHPVFGGLREGLVGQKEFEQQQICLPCHEGLSYENIQQIIDTVQRGW